MAQRGGSVNCSVRIGNVSGPLVANGTADAIISTEPIEALRYVQFSNKNTKIITDITLVIPFTVSSGGEEYPDIKLVFKELSNYGKLYKIDAVKIARDAGALITKNIVMLGALAAIDVLPFKSEILLDTILENIPTKFKEINKKAFENGLKAIKK
jgi:indolepyruvate ferredoxin oxidoreductase beta subunit